MIREQQKIALQEEIVDYDAYRLKPNKMQIEVTIKILFEDMLRKEQGSYLELLLFTLMRFPEREFFSSSTVPGQMM